MQNGEFVEIGVIDSSLGFSRDHIENGILPLSSRSMG